MASCGKKLPLTKLQQRFQQHLLLPEADALADMVATTPELSRAARLHIYSNAYRERMVEALDADYHQLHVFLGDDEYSRLIYAYLRAHPSKQPSLRRFGARLPQFLRQTRPYCLHPELAELADFEWALCHAFDAADADAIGLEELTALPPEQLAALRLDFHPSLKEATPHSEAPAVWQALNDNPSAPPPDFNWPQEARTWLVWRQELRLMFRPSAPDEAWALDAFRNRRTFGDVCEGLCRWHEDERVPQRAVALLQQWVNEQLVIALTTTVS